MKSPRLASYEGALHVVARLFGEDEARQVGTALAFDKANVTNALEQFTQVEKRSEMSAPIYLDYNASTPIAPDDSVVTTTPMGIAKSCSLPQ
jgi:hypothetical protein